MLRRPPFWRKRNPTATVAPTQPTIVELDLAITDDDPLLTYLVAQSQPVLVENVRVASPALDQLRRAGVELVVPLVNQGELIGMLNLGRRRSDQGYSADDRHLLNDLATHAAPAMRVAQLVREQQTVVAERSRIEQELRVARLIQQTLLPQSLPQISGWKIDTHYQPAREVGGDFFDFLPAADGKLGIIIGDVTDKGIPAALVMATTRTLLRAVAERLATPGAVLERVNNLLYADIPPRMFVTCFFALLDPIDGTLQFANAGHDVPYWRSPYGVYELRARGMPLGLMPDMRYEELTVQIRPDDTLFFYSDGLAEAHNRAREMFGFPRVCQLVNQHDGTNNLIRNALDELAQFTGEDWTQEDDITLVTVRYEGNWQEIGRKSFPSELGCERTAMRWVEEMVKPFDLPNRKLNRLKTAVTEAVMNSAEHAHGYNPACLIDLRVSIAGERVKVDICDHGDGYLDANIATPDLTAKLNHEQTPRGWGLFLMQKMVDEMQVTQDDEGNRVALIVNG